MPPIYLDHNATTPVLPAAADAVRAALADGWGNPSSGHAAGRAARRRLDDARERVAARLAADPAEVVFTGGATEANNLAVFGLAVWAGGRNPSPGPSPEGGGEQDKRQKTGRGHEHDRPLLPLPPPPALGEGAGGRGDAPAAPHLLAAPIEHPCVVEPLRALAGRGFALEWLPVTARGQVEPDAVLARVTDRSRLVCLMLANHETGAVQPVKEVAARLPAHARLHTDAAQAVGKIPVRFRDLGADTLAASGHKFGGPPGVGLLLVRTGVTLAGHLFGGHQQAGRRPGTEPVALAVGLAVALDHAVREMDATAERLTALRRRLLERLRAAAAPVVLNGPEPGDPDGLPTTLNVSFPGVRGDLLLVALDLAGVACSTGSACSSGSLLPSPVVRAMGVPDDVLRSAVRISVGVSTMASEVDRAAEIICQCVERMRGSGGR